MAHFRGIVKNDSGEASRLGNKKTGLTVTCDGWDDGIKVIAHVNKDGQNVFRIYKTGGTNNIKTQVGDNIELIATVKGGAC